MIRLVLFGLLIAGLCGSIVYAAHAYQQDSRRQLQKCSSISRRKRCRKTTVCQWKGRRLGCGPIPTPPPSPPPVSIVNMIFYLFLLLSFLTLTHMRFLSNIRHQILHLHHNRPFLHLNRRSGKETTSS